MSSRWEQSQVPRGSEYDERFERLARAGHDVHGEASFVMGFGPDTVLDAGCGTGRVAIELARRGVSVVGVDLDRAMLETACEKAPDIEWFRSDLSTLGLPSPDVEGDIRTFDVVLTAGNVMIFLGPGTEAAAVWRLAEHLVPGGALVCGFQLLPDRYGLDAYDADCADAGLVLGRALRLVGPRAVVTRERVRRVGASPTDDGSRAAERRPAGSGRRAPQPAAG